MEIIMACCLIHKKRMNIRHLDNMQTSQIIKYLVHITTVFKKIPRQHFGYPLSD